MASNKLYKFIRVDKELWHEVKMEAAWRDVSMVAVLNLGLEALRAPKDSLAGPRGVVASRGTGATPAPVQPVRELTYVRDE